MVLKILGERFGLLCVVGCFRDELLQAAKLFGSDFAVVEQREQKALAGVSEKSLDEVTDLGAAGFALGDAGAVEEGPPLLAVGDVSLALEDA